MPARLTLALSLIALAVLAANAPAATSKRLDGTAVISFRGVGPIKLGMTLTQARRAARRTIVAGPEVTRHCRHDRVRPRRLGLATLRFKRHIRVLYVTRRGLATARGIRVRDTVTRLKSKYGARLVERGSDVSPDTRIFELRNGRREIQFSVSRSTGRISQIATGLRPEVDFSEGCA
jgi:hypothetical protein